MIQRIGVLNIVLILIFIFVGNVYSQQIIEIKKLSKPILIDGILEEEWFYNDSTTSTNFTQLEPNKGMAATRKTEVRAAQFKENIYFSFICYKHKGDQVASRILRRDQLDDSDDIVAIVIDTYSDKRNAMLFMVNALGTLTDIKIIDDGNEADRFWDTEWEAKTSVTDSFWVVEINIPLKSIQYNPDNSTWGINFGRVIRSNQETVWWVPVTENFRVSQSGILTGIKPEQEKKHSLTLFPYATLRYENSDITGVHKKIKGDGGLDMKYHYSSNFTANLTVNPDFATVEGDREQINLSPWELSFPEKRLFFQDGNEMFGTRIKTFYSRRIGDIDYGGKIIGKSGKLQYNVLSARTKSDIENNNSFALFNAARIKLDVFNSSTIGLTYADKILDTATTRSLSLDYVVNLGETWKFTGQYVGSSPGDLIPHSAWYVRFARENNIYNYHVRFTNIGENFRKNVNETGFIRDDNRREIDSDIGYRFWINKYVRYISTAGKHNIYWSQKGVLRSWYLTYKSRIYLDNKFSFEAAYNNEYKLFDKEYYNYFYQGELGYNTDEASYINIAYIFGRNFDSDFQLLEIETRVLLFEKLSINYELTHIKYTPDPLSKSTTINVVGIDYFLNKDLWTRFFVQNNTATNKFYFYGLIGWRFNPPFGAAYIIVNTDKFNDNSTFEQINSEIIFLKLTLPLTIL